MDSKSERNAREKISEKIFDSIKAYIYAMMMSQKKNNDEM